MHSTYRLAVSLQAAMYLKVLCRHYVVKQMEVLAAFFSCTGQQDLGWPRGGGRARSHLAFQLGSTGPLPPQMGTRVVRDPKT